MREEGGRKGGRRGDILMVLFVYQLVSCDIDTRQAIV